MAWPVKRLSLLLLAALGLAGLAGIALVAADSVPLAPDSVIRESLCRRMILGTTEGRQGLVSSVWFAPLPTVARLPLVYLLPDSLIGLPSRLVSLFFGLAALVVLARTAWRWAGGLPAALVTLGLAAQPAFLVACVDGGDATTAAFFLLLAASSWSRWVLEDRLTHLSLMSLAAALLCLTRFELVGWTAAGFVFVLLHEYAAPRLPGQRQAILILGLLPWAYGVSLWVMGNWLIMGDALYFLRGLGSLAPASQPFPSPALPWADPAWWLPLAFPALLLPIALVRRESAGASLAALTLAMALLAAALDALGCLWDAPVFLLGIPVLAAVCLARLAGFVPRGWPAAKTGLAAAGVLIPLLLLGLRPAAWNPVPAGPPPLREDSRDMLAEIKALVDSQTPFATVYVCGYESFPMLDGNRDPNLLRELDFDFSRARREYAGRTLFLLVPRPESREATESIHRKFPGIYARGYGNTLLTAKWDRWHLFELVDKPREEDL
jgi:hypothetical protein